MPKPLTVSLPSDTQIQVDRAFDAPPELIFRAWFEPALVRRWLLGPPGWTMPECEIDGRVGGAYRFVWTSDDGQHTMAIGGVYKDIARPHGWTATERFEPGWYEGEALVRSTLVDQGGKTQHSMVITYETKEGRDMALQSGMSDGMEAGYQRLDAILAEETV